MRHLLLMMLACAGVILAQEQRSLMGPPLGPPEPPGFNLVLAEAVPAVPTPPNPWDSYLSIYITNIVDEAVVDYWHVQAPEIAAAGGVGNVPVVCYTGPAYWITVTAGEAVVMECSDDAAAWRAFPAPGFQMTFAAGTNSFFIPCELGPRFYRARNQ